MIAAIINTFKFLFRVLTSITLFFILTPAYALDKRPNILIILADDLGYSDLGSYGGGDIETPNLDKLAYEGLRFSNFYMSPTCSPSRSMLLTGVDNHRTGLGSMHEWEPLYEKRRDGYEGYLNNRVTTVATMLKKAGYSTFLSGKWHLGHEIDLGPWEKGFDQSFTAMTGAHNHFQNVFSTPKELWKYMGPAPIHWENGKPVNTLPDYFYSSNYFTQKIIEYIDNTRHNNQPFFGYLSFTAPHWPLQAPNEAIQKYRGKYTEGYDILRERRAQGMIDKGVIQSKNYVLKRPNGLSPWKSLEESDRTYLSRAMEIYAAMVDIIDWNVGRLIAYLERIGERENTIILFMSDNGAEGLSANHPALKRFLNSKNKDIENLGDKNSFVIYGTGWAHASSGALSGTKGSTSDGGMKVPLIINSPLIKNKGEVSHALITARDITPTLLDFAGIKLTNESMTNNKFLISGKSFIKILNGKDKTIHENEILAWELGGQKAVLKNTWKLVGEKESKSNSTETKWRLYNLATDPSEQHNLSEHHKQVYSELISYWRVYAAKHNIQ